MQFIYKLFISCLLLGQSNAQSTRPARNAVANLPAMVAACRGTEENLELIRHTQHCLSYLADSQTEYLTVDGSADTLALTQEQLQRPVTVDTKQQDCPGEVFIYHAYWAGSFTWRVEIFIKSFLFTQDILCSQLWLWVDVSENENAIEEMINHPLVTQFLSLIDQGTLDFRPWTTPARIPIRSDLDNTDGMGFVDNMERRGAYPDSPIVADGINRDPSGQLWLLLTYWAEHTDLSTVSTSDVVRFVVLHMHGGVYLDVDVIFLRDMRPLLLHGDDFAERWGALSGSGDYNTAILRLHANSSLSTWFLRTGMRLSMNFHPRTIGRALWKDGRAGELLKLESGFFDPIWPEFAQNREGPCTSPCLKKFTSAFEENVEVEKGMDVKRSSENFYRGAYAYHIHNLWKKPAEPQSWIGAIKREHNRFFRKESTNGYHEWWTHESLADYV